MKHSIAMKSALTTAILGFLALCLASTPALASTTTGNVTVTVTVQTSCTVSTDTLAFAPYSGTTENGSSTGLTVTCSNGTPYNIGLDGGLHGGTPGGTNYMQIAGGTTKVSYQLFSNSGYSTPWGNTIGTNTVSSTGTGIAQTPFVIYGTIPAGQAVVAGNYSDTVIATVTY
jgi:spore coat protein U-like protein